jgi:plastocyanin
MKIEHILVLLVVIMISGCGAKPVEQPDQGTDVTPPAEDEQPPVEPETPPVEPESPEEDETVSGEDIQILSRAFDPEEITVAPGSVVTFRNTDDKVHIVAVIGGERSQRLEEGDTFEYNFEEVGTYEVIDPIFGFKATITVQE